jgi:hypothetical protein
MYKTGAIVSLIFSGLCPVFMIMTMNATRGTQDTKLFIGWAIAELFTGLAAIHLFNQKD